MDRKFDRIVQFDVRSRNFPIRTLVAAKKPRSYTWRCFANLDQGSEGACVGFAWAHELAARPCEIKNVIDQTAKDVYHRAQELDDYDGTEYSGTSVLAGAKAIVERKWMLEYRWSFSLDDLILAVGYAGPVVLGINWYEGMAEVDDKGYLQPTGEILGGHAILCRAVSVTKRRFLLHNSWGPYWGEKGTAWITFDDLDRLLHEQGEACVPVKRKMI